MSDMNTHRRMRRVLVQTLILGTLVGLCLAGHRHDERTLRPRHPRHQRHQRHHARHTQRIEYPLPNDQGAQRAEFPSFLDRSAQWLRDNLWFSRGSKPQTPSNNDTAASAQIQKCAPGYYRESSGAFLGRCVQCECNGLADECEDGTGKCLDCQYNTAGDQCERCKGGYYGSAAQRTCRVCPCPFTTPANSFAVGCMDVGGDVQCVCRAGYSGERCENCAHGYYGDPLTPGGSCKRCNCFGNSNNCDPKTGVCKSTLEPGDTNIDDTCKECDNCAQTLLQDLEKLDDELGRIKTQLDNASASASSQERLKKLEKAVQDTKTLVSKYGSAVNSQKAKVAQMEEDMNTLEDDVDAVKNKADKRAADADKAVADVQKTHDRAKDLDSEIQNMLKKIQALLDQLKNEGNRGDTPNENLSKLLEDAKKMVDEMEKKNFTPQKTAAEKERDEAKKLLDNIKTKITNQADQNEAAAQKLRNLLKDYDSKLKDLDKALKDASDFVKKASGQNGLNSQTLGDLQKRIDDMRKERKTVEDQMKLADGELKKTEGLVKKLTDSKTEYEKLAAQLDGAKTDLTKKVNDITKAAAKKDVVEAAEDHANNLKNLAKQLEDTVRSASDRPEVRNAKDAIDAYANITDAINAADAAAKDAKKAADEAFNNVNKQKLPDKVRKLKDNSDELLKNAQDANEVLKDVSNQFPNLLKRLTDADNKKKALEGALQDAVSQLNNINRDDVSNMIDEAKRKAAAANDTAADTMDRLGDIKKELEKINTSPSSSNLGGVLDDVDQSVKNLWKAIPSLSDKISQVEDLTSGFTPITNISNNIKKIKELIEHARDAANRIMIPMTFTGNSHVELRPPKNLDDLKAYTAMSLSLQRPEGRGDGRRRRRQTREKEDLFVLYLGHRDSTKNYIGMALRDNILYGVYKLNGVEHEMRTGYISKSTSEPAKFDRVDLRRIYQDAQMTLTKDATAPKPGEPIKSVRQGDESKNLLDLSPSDVVFYVGGYPDDFTPPPSLNYPKYKGCIEFSYFNDRASSLYNFQKAVNINEETPCKRYVPPTDQNFYEGTGFGRGFIPPASSSTLFISMSVFAHSENGLLIYLGGENKYFTMTTEKGVIYIRSNMLAAPVTKNLKVFPTSDWIDLQFIFTKIGKIYVRVGSVEAAQAQAQYSIEEFKEFYIGGAPQDLRERDNITMQPFKGCVKNLKLNKGFKLVDEQVGVSKRCPAESLVSRRAEFGLGSSLSASLQDLSLDNDVTVSIGFKSTKQEGLILQDKKQANGIALQIENGYVIVVVNNKVLKSKEQYHDGMWHYVTVTRRAGKVGMLIDDKDSGVEQQGSINIPDSSGTLFLGDEKFKGCLSNLYTQRPGNLYKPEDLSSFKASGDVLLDACAADTLAQLMMDRQSKKR